MEHMYKKCQDKNGGWQDKKLPLQLQLFPTVHPWTTKIQLQPNASLQQELIHTKNKEKKSNKKQNCQRMKFQMWNKPLEKNKKSNTVRRGKHVRKRCAPSNLTNIKEHNICNQKKPQKKKVPP